MYMVHFSIAAEPCGGQNPSEFDMVGICWNMTESTPKIEKYLSSRQPRRITNQKEPLSE